MRVKQREGDSLCGCIYTIHTSEHNNVGLVRLAVPKALDPDIQTTNPLIAQHFYGSPNIVLI